MPWVDEGRYPGEVDRLTTLPLALDPAHMAPVLAGRALATLGEPFAIGNLDVDIYRRHGNRCVIRYRAHGTLAGNGAAEWRVIGKVLHRPSAMRVPPCQRRLSASTPVLAGRVQAGRSASTAAHCCQYSRRSSMSPPVPRYPK